MSQMLQLCVCLMLYLESWLRSELAVHYLSECLMI